MSDCIFCKIASKEAPAHIIWEDDSHMAFLSIFPNTEGTTVVIPKEHKDSSVFNLEDKELAYLVLASKKTSKMLEAAFDDVGKVALVFEGFGVDHAHAKLYPMHGTGNMTSWKPIESNQPVYYEKYPGYVDSRDGEMSPPEELESVLKKIKSES